MKLFISHSEKDKDIITKIVDLLYIIGMQEKDMFCSSVVEIGIPNKEDIYEYLRNILEKEDVYVLFLLSDNYYASPVCLNEMGAAWVTRKDYTVLLAPGFEYACIKGAINPRKISIKLDDDNVKYRLGEFKNDLEKYFHIHVSQGKWEKYRDQFLESLQSCNKEISFSNSEALCIGDQNREGCVIRDKTKDRLTVDVDFTKTSSTLCSAVIYTSEVNWKSFVQNDKEIVFDINVSPSIHNLTLELQIPSAGRNVRDKVKMLNGTARMRLKEFCPPAEQCTRVTQVNFLISESDIDTSGSFTVSRMYIE